LLLVAVAVVVTLAVVVAQEGVLEVCLLVMQASHLVLLIL
jgi:hypothetical protein